jgi:tyrosine-protein phosphatase SIW14
MKRYDGRKLMVSLNRLVVLTAWFVGAGCVNVSADGHTKTSHSAEKHTPPSIPMFAKVSDTLYRGGQPTHEGFSELKKMGIKTVVLLRVFENEEDEISARLGLQYFHISFKSHHPEDEDVVEFLRIATTPEYQPVFVHCRYGTDRTGMMVAAYRIVIQDLPKEKALEEMKKSGFNEVWEPLEEYIEHLDVEKMRRQLVAALSHKK